MNAGGGLTSLDQPLGVIKAHTLELVLTQRYAYGLTGHAAFSANRVTENRTVEEYDREPTLWQTNNNGRPWRLTGVASTSCPSVRAGRSWTNGGVFSHLARGWSVSGTYEYQPGALLTGANLFFNGNLADIKKDKPEIALQPDGTIDPTKTWFNTEAGFVKATADQPAGFQKRVFPFRVEGVRGQSLSMTNMSVARTFTLGGRPDVPVPGGRAEPLQPAALREPELGPDKHGLRAGPGGE